MWFPTVLAALSTIAVPTVTLQPEYHYYSGDAKIKTVTSKPVTFNGIAIGTAELNASDVGNWPALGDAHHFRHPGWVLADTNGGSWEYIEYRTIQNGTELKEHAEEIFSFLDLTDSEGSVHAFSSLERSRRPEDGTIIYPIASNGLVACRSGPTSGSL
jgi:hypothetical protein